MWDIIGHERAVQALQHSINTGHVAHAYLFAGAPHIGKTTVTLTLAQALNCAAAEPVGRRKRIRQDLIAIDDIRDMQRSVALAPLEGRCKVVVIAGAERMTIEAANALLKTLEEPPDRVVLALTTADAGLLLPTIVSRCQVVPLARLSRQQVEAVLQERWGAEPAQAHLLAALSGGRLGWAITALQDEAILTERADHVQLLTRALEAGPAERLDLAKDLGQQRDQAITMLHTWLAWARDMWLIALGCPDRIVNIDHAPALQTVAQRVGAPAGQDLILALQDTLRQLDQNVNPRLAFEVLLLSLPQQPVME
ncbi:MAG: DNA polymerase III subunit delta' [Chloroflexi bacterium]|nr:DNA polymerase III subunit delta' [Chloroflexota bacterium]